MLEAAVHRCSIKKGVLKNLAKFRGKHMCWSHFLIGVKWVNLKRIHSPLFHLPPFILSIPFENINGDSKQQNEIRRQGIINIL